MYRVRYASHNAKVKYNARGCDLTPGTVLEGGIATLERLERLRRFGILGGRCRQC
jgi:hypothetical protein